MTVSRAGSTRSFLPYARQLIDTSDIRAVTGVLRSGHLTTGPAVRRFESGFKTAVGAKHAVAVSSGTAALHTALLAAGIGAGDEVITTPYTFVATASTILHSGARPVFVDVVPGGFNLDPSGIPARLTKRTKSIVAVHFAGEPCDLDALTRISGRHGLILIEDAAHALGAAYQGRKIGSIGDLTAFSFHPAKHITTAEGGMVTTNSSELADRMRRIRNHGLSLDVHEREARQTWMYDVMTPGYNYRLSDIQSALGTSQLRKLSRFLRRRRSIARAYQKLIGDMEELVLPSDPAGRSVRHGWHLYVVRVKEGAVRGGRDAVYKELIASGIGVNVHYRPVHLFSCYRRLLGTRPGDFPNAERSFREALTLPLFPAMTAGDVQRVATALRNAVGRLLIRKVSRRVRGGGAFSAGRV